TRAGSAAASGQVDLVVGTDDFVVAARQADAAGAATETALPEEVARAERILDRIAICSRRLERRALAVVAGVDVADDDVLAAETLAAVESAGENRVLPRGRVPPNGRGADEARTDVGRKRMRHVEVHGEYAGYLRHFRRLFRRQLQHDGIERVLHGVARRHRSTQRGIDRAQVLLLLFFH